MTRHSPSSSPRKFSTAFFHYLVYIHPTPLECASRTTRTSPISRCTMSVVGSLIFCVDCGNLLDSSNSQKRISCTDCQRSYDSSSFANLKVVTRSSDDAFPSALRLKKSVVKTVLKSSELEEGATIKEKCPQCGNEEMQYHTLQLRSADEGATVFYTCTGCGYRFRTNN